MKKFVLKIISGLAVFWTRMHGVVVGGDPYILGFPDIKRATGSTIIVGDNVSLFSSRWANPLRPARRLSLVTLQRGASIVIGNKAGISSSVISCATSIHIGEGTFIGSDCIIADTDFHSVPLNAGKAPRTKPIVIGRDVFVGMRCLILKGVEIGDGAVIGAGSVVAKSIPANSIAAGNPAKVLAIT